ncbi:MAG: alkaline phosphatase family protein, partial [Acidobacteria bacterium]|nr:alkaline phosphatase family protein [Acidobacteriota bacterium]
MGSIFLYRYVSLNIPAHIPFAINHLKGKSFWEIAAEKGVKSIVIRHPDTYPAKPFKDGRLLSGLGVPDLRGRIGTPTIITTDYSLKMRDNEFSVEIVPVGFNVYEEKVEIQVPGPYNKPFYSYPLSEYEDGCVDDELKDNLKKEAKKELERRGVSETIYFPVSLKVDKDAGDCQIEISGKSIILKEKEWSEWIEIDFKFSNIVKIKGLIRFYLMQTQPELKLYISPIQIHPDNNLHISYPESYARDLFKRFGPFKTMGWAVDTWTVSSGLSDEEQFLSDMYRTEEAYEKIMVQLLKDGDCELYVQIYEFTDRIGHILWRYLDDKHPLFDGANSGRFRNELKKSYVYMDKIIGEAMDIIPKDCVLIVLSDHGFASLRKEGNYNRWLVDNGLMVLKDDTGLMSLYDLFDDNRLLFKNVDWSKTKAYSLGLGNIYINLKGREKEGIVSEGKEYEEVV